MNPLLILIPVGALIFGPRLWVSRVTRRHSTDDEALKTGAEVARELLDHHHLRNVKVEITDIGDHYDPDAKVVRLGRDRFDRRTLTAVTTAAHEVAHAIQDAEGYLPFVLRTHLASLAQVAGQAGSAILIAVPAVSLASGQRIPPAIIGTAIFAILGTGIAVQLAALPTEIDASFRRALPMLKTGYITQDQVKDAHHILLASSFTYVASSLLAVLSIWPWVGRPPVRVYPTPPARLALMMDAGGHASRTQDARAVRARRTPGVSRGAGGLTRLIARPLIRAWLRTASATGT